MNQQTIAFIGGGNMAASIIGGLIKAGRDPGLIQVVDINPERLEWLHKEYGVNIFDTALSAATGAETIVLAVKPNTVSTVCQSLSEVAKTQSSVVISIAAGIREPDIRRWLGYDAAIVRCMPNTPALLGAGASALYANPYVTSPQRVQAQQVMDACGMNLWVDEELQLDAVTALSGSGPAYYFLLMEEMIRAGEHLGLDAETARQLTLQTALGAARMALESDVGPDVLRQRVTSPGGTTHAAIESFKANGIDRLVLSAMTAACERAAQMGDELGSD
jgi:pyrroline-5-carboxylate reductase